MEIYLHKYHESSPHENQPISEALHVDRPICQKMRKRRLEGELHGRLFLMAVQRFGRQTGVLTVTDMM